MSTSTRVDVALPPVLLEHPHVTVSPALLAGSPVVLGSRVPVRRLWEWHRKGVTVETLVARYPGLGPAAILDALSFAYDNEALIRADVARELEQLEALEPIPGAPSQTKLGF